MINEEINLQTYANKYNFNELSGEDIIKLMNKPYMTNEIADAFNITIYEFNKIKKNKGVENIYLENAIRNIDTVIYFIDEKGKYFSNTIIKKVANELIDIFTMNIPNREYYRKKLKEIDFNREKIRTDIMEKGIDVEYRINELTDVTGYSETLISDLVKEEREFFFEYNHQKLYNELIKKQKNGQDFSKKDLTYDILFELEIVENIPDSLIGNIFNMSENQIKYLRAKNNLPNKFEAKLLVYPEALIYRIEDANQRDENMSNYEYDKLHFDIMAMALNKNKEELILKAENIVNPNNVEPKNVIKENEVIHDITIKVEGKDITYHVKFSNETFSPTSKTNSKRKSKGSRHNYNQENKTKILHGKVGEKLVFNAEKLRLKDLGLDYLIDKVKLVAQVDEDITFDGLGYDLISFNEKKEPICIEVKTTYGTKDRPFFVSQKEIDVIEGLIEEHDCKDCLIYYLLIDNYNVTIKTIDNIAFKDLKKAPILYKIG